MYAIIDIETTGGNYDEEGITEIAIYRYDGEKITDQFISLINPQRSIQPFVKKLTGINEKMLLNAPKFHEVAKRIIEITDNCIFVAHNAMFDYRVIQTEFRRLGYRFERQTLCTINLSKELLPEQNSFNLEKLVCNLGIPFTKAHRADGDAKATLKLFEILIEKDSKKHILKTHIKLSDSNKLSKKVLKIIDNLPSKMGMFYMQNIKKDIIYIGKSNNIKNRVLNILTKKGKKELAIQKEVSNVTFSITGGKLLTLLKEQNEIKRNIPKFNKTDNSRLFPMGIRVNFNSSYAEIIIEQIICDRSYLNVYKNKKTAKAAVFKWAKEFGICIKKTNLKAVKNECPNYKTNKFANCCINNQTSINYNKKIQNLINSFSYPHQNFLIIEKGRKNGESAFIYIANYQYRGYGYYELNHQIKSENQILSRLVKTENNYDSKKLIQSFLSREKFLKLVPINI